MDLSYGAEGETFRSEVAAFLAGTWPPTQPADAAAVKAFRRLATDRGYLYRGVPRRYGGAEQPTDVIRAQIIREEFGRVRAPMEAPGNGVNMLVPTLLECGAEWQKQQFIPPTLAGDYVWAQGYSEPGAGSDLASVRTRGVLDGDRWVINGQKIWTSGAHISHYMFALVRTEPEAPKHAGLSYLLLDLRQPGVTIRPLRQMTGESGFSEVFFDNATTPADWIVGERGQGWRVSRTTLRHERASIGNAERGIELVDKLVALARSTQRFGRPAIEDREIRQRLAALEGWAMAQKYTGYRLFSQAAAGEEPGIEALIGKLLVTEIGHEAAHLALELISDSALLQPAPPGKGARGDEKWLDQIMGSLGVAIAGGASNIQRNIIAERGLGLPRDMAAESDGL